MLMLVKRDKTGFLVSRLEISLKLGGLRSA